MIYKKRNGILIFTNLILPLSFISIYPLLNQNTINLPEKQFFVTTVPQWYEFNATKKSKVPSKDSSVYVGSFSFKTKKTYHLKKIQLHWIGESLGPISASLYEKKHDKDPLLPIQSHLVCDGTWNAQKQQLTFHLNRKVYSVDSLYLVLSFPATMTEKLKNGLFILDENNPVTLISA